MKTIITAVFFTMTISLTAQVNKFIFASGIEFNQWNKDIINGTLIYMNNPMDDNYSIYLEAVATIENMGGDFNIPNVDESVSNGSETLMNIIYEKGSSASNSYLKRVYYINDNTVTVFISGIQSSIRID
jgi:hypothetical protein